MLTITRDQIKGRLNQLVALYDGDFDEVEASYYTEFLDVPTAILETIWQDVMMGSYDYR